MEVAGFTSSLPFAKVRDFAYHDKHPLHYGVRTNNDSDDAAQHGAGDHDLQGSSKRWTEEVSESAEQGQTAEELASHRNEDDIYRRAVALFDFEPENSNEARLVEGQVVWISYRHGQGWLVSENLETGETGLVPEEYVQVLPENDEEWVDTA